MSTTVGFQKHHCGNPRRIKSKMHSKKLRNKLFCPIYASTIRNKVEEK